MTGKTTFVFIKSVFIVDDIKSFSSCVANFKYFQIYRTLVNWKFVNNFMLQIAFSSKFMLFPIFVIVINNHKLGTLSQHSRKEEVDSYEINLTDKEASLPYQIGICHFWLSKWF